MRACACVHASVVLVLRVSTVLLLRNVRAVCAGVRVRKRVHARAIWTACAKPVLVCGQRARACDVRARCSHRDDPSVHAHRPSLCGARGAERDNRERSRTGDDDHDHDDNDDNDGRDNGGGDDDHHHEAALGVVRVFW